MIASDSTRRFLASAGACLIAALLPASAAAQTADPNPGGLTLTGGLHVPTVYLFRGILQESDPELTLWPFFDVGAAIYSGDGGIKSVGVNVGLWNSLHTGTSGGSSDVDDIHYEEDFYATLALGFARGITVSPTFTAYTSPNRFFSTVKEISFKVAQAHRWAPYGIVAFELDNQADGGSEEGTYLELGVGPNWPAGGGNTLTIPIKLGLSLDDYYEGPTGDEKFGFFDIGALYTVPIRGGTRFGAWSVHVGVDLFTLGDTTEALNKGDKTRVVGQGGITVTY
jgi:hypothetical protein